MYSTCIFCHVNLGSNEAVEAFTVGRKLAFDAAKGRLWVICERCTRWNLSPLEERWEAIEESERLFRSTRLRVSTDNIGLARLRDGTELVRVGSPQRPELAAWRYGEQFRRRHRRNMAYVIGGTAVSVPLLMTGAYTALAALPGGGFLIQVPGWIQIYQQKRAVVARAPTADGERAMIRGKHLRHARLTTSVGGSGDQSWGLSVRHDKGASEINGNEAIQVAAKVLAQVNKVGGSPKSVRRAVDRLDHEGGSERLFGRIASNPVKESSGLVQWWSGAGVDTGGDPAGTLRSLALSDRLALEMATHEESERRALEGELATLRDAWREAEEIASIADSLTLPEHIQVFIRRYRS